MKKYLLILLSLAILCFAFTSCEYLSKENDNNVTISFDTDGGSTVEAQSVTKGETVIEPKDPTKEGYIFDGWYVNDSKWDFNTEVSENVTLKAKWIVIIYDVHFIDENGVLIGTQTVPHGNKITKPENPQKEDFLFDGWYVNDSEWDFNTPVTQDLTLSSHWRPVIYHTVSYISAGNYYTTSVKSGDVIQESTPMEISGWTFEGWYSDDVKWDFSTPITEDVTLVAKWSSRITYVLDGGTNVSSNPTVIYSGDRYPIQLYDPSKSGYTFVGWSTDGTYDGIIDSIYFFSSYTLYAIWESNTELPTGDYPWSKTDITICINEDSDSSQLLSTSRRYLAGNLSGCEDYPAHVDDYVADRNAEAEKETNVKARYVYLPDGASYGWGQNIDFINEWVKSCDPDTPDVFVNFVYDMVASSLRGNFANLYSTTMYREDHEYAGSEYNYFEFEDNRAFVDTGVGYMYDYMRSLTLSKWKMYCLASDYFIDAVRAFFVVPVNIELLEMITPSNVAGEYNYDSNENGKYDINDFYELVWNMDWTYDTLASFSEAIALEQGGDENLTLEDRVGFALGTGSGLPASAMLYTTSITIVKREFAATTLDYTYSYPNTKEVGAGSFAFDEQAFDTTFEELTEFCNNLKDLVNTDGVITVSADEARALGYAKGDSEAIRKRFSNGGILFGGVIVLGALEHEDYLAMKGAGKKGYGIAPVPLYHTGSDDQYLTQIHNNGKIGAIAYSTQKFAQCTAYLNYQSTNSNKVLNEYYDYKLKATVQVLDAAGNVEMLQYIRYNVRSSFDKAFEDALGEFYKAQTGSTSEKDKWHNMIKNADFQFTDMRAEYARVVATKANRLYNLEHSIYPTLPD